MRACLVIQLCDHRNRMWEWSLFRFTLNIYPTLQEYTTTLVHHLQNNVLLANVICQYQCCPGFISGLQTSIFFSWVYDYFNTSKNVFLFVFVLYCFCVLPATFMWFDIFLGRIYQPASIEVKLILFLETVTKWLCFKKRLDNSSVGEKNFPLVENKCFNFMWEWC